MPGRHMKEQWYSSIHSHPWHQRSGLLHSLAPVSRERVCGTQQRDCVHPRAHWMLWRKKKKVSCTLLGIERCFPGLPAHTHHCTDWAIPVLYDWVKVLINGHFFLGNCSFVFKPSCKQKHADFFLGNCSFVFKPSCKQKHADNSWDTHRVPKTTILFWLSNT